MTKLAIKIQKALNWDIMVPATLDGSRVDALEAQFKLQAQLRIQHHQKEAQTMDGLAASAAKQGDTKYAAHCKRAATTERSTADEIATYLKTGQLGEFMQPLKAIAAQSGDKSRFDSWDEVHKASKLFHDSQYFHRDAKVGQLARGLRQFLPKWTWHDKQDVTSYATLRALKPIILKDLGISSMSGRLADYVKNQPIANLTSWRGLPVFGAFSTKLSAQLAETQNRKPTILYPGAGTHYAYLQTLADLVRSSDIDSARVIATDLDTNMMTVRHDFKELQRAGVIKNLRVSEPNSPEYFKDGGTEQSITFQMQGPAFAIPITIVYALRRSGEAYFRDEYLKQADAVIIHDPGEGEIAASEKLLSDVVAAKRRVAPTRKQLVILEAAAKLPSGLNATKIAGPYGHGLGSDGLGEFYNCGDGAQSVRLPNQDIIKTLSRTTISSTNSE